MSQRFELTQYHCEAACFPLLRKGFEKYIKKEKDFFGLNAFLGFASSYKKKYFMENVDFLTSHIAQTFFEL